jgi:hypothetical protein
VPAKEMSSVQGEAFGVVKVQQDKLQEYFADNQLLNRLNVAILIERVWTARRLVW